MNPLGWLLLIVIITSFAVLDMTCRDPVERELVEMPVDQLEW